MLYLNYQINGRFDMAKRLVVIVLALCFVLTPFTAVAEDDVRALLASGNYKYSDSLYENNEISGGARLTFEYNKDEQKKSKNSPDIGCKAAYVADPITGKVFYEKNAHQKMYPASTTKILTALVVLENCDVDETVKVSQNAIDLMPEGYSNAGLVAGEEHSVYTMLQALLIPSANEAAYALAEHVSGSVSAFAELCNKRAKELGCENLHFVNPNGVHDDNHYCCAYDLYLIAKECKKYETFNEIVKMKSFTVPPSNVYKKNDRTYDNTNEMLEDGQYYYKFCTGIKTGHTTPAGECLVASSSNDDLNLISVVLGGSEKNGKNERFTDTKKLFEFVYENYKFKKITDKTAPLSEVNVIDAVTEQERLNLIIQTDIYTVAPNNASPDNVQPQLDLAEEIKAPIEQNQVLGTVTYSVDGLIYSTNIVAANEVEKKPYMLWNALVALGAVSVIIILALIIRKAKKKTR